MKRLVVSIIALLAFGLSFAQTNLDLAEQAIENGEYTLAAYYASEHLEANPKDASAYAMRSLAYAYQEEYVSAFADADKAIASLKASGEDAYVLGELVESEEGVIIC